jgi:hypothetical protein
MFQIDVPTAAAVEPTPAAPGTPGYFTDGNAIAGTPPTIVPADWFNQITDELLAIVIAGGLTPSKSVRNQVLLAIRSMLLALGGGYPILVNSSQTLSPGVYYTDTSQGPITITTNTFTTECYTFVDATNSWGTNNLTVNGGGYPIGNIVNNTATTFLANVSDYQFSMVPETDPASHVPYWRLV